jgi:hypothetical protein
MINDARVRTLNAPCMSSVKQRLCLAEWTSVADPFGN